MTILPKKKHQEIRKNDQDHDTDNRNRVRNRPRDTVRNNRLQQHQPTDEFDFDELGNGLEASVPPLATPIFNDLETRDTLEGLPHKRSRHKQGSSYFLPPNSHPSNSPHSSSRVVGREETPDGDGGIEDGYNSSDEHGPCDDPTSDDLAISKGAETVDYAAKEAEFERELREEKGFIIKQMATDGACMFRAVADQVYGDQEMHTVVRRHCMDYMVQNRDFFSQYITEDFLSYIRRKRVDHSHGNHIEMQALSEMYNRPIEVYQYSYEPINTFLSRSLNSDDNPPIRLSYHGNIHYNSVIDPYNPTVGVGLGLAGYKPGLEDEQGLNKAAKDSEALLLEQAMLEDKIKATDWEATDEQLAELAARESYLQWMKDNQKASNLSQSGGACSSSTSTQSKRPLPTHDNNNNSNNSNNNNSNNNSSSRRSPPRSSNDAASILPRRSPPRDTTKRSPPHHSESGGRGGSTQPLSKHVKGDGSSCAGAGAGGMETSEHDKPAPNNDWSFALGYGGSDWDSDPVLAAVLAQSQQEYLDSFTRTNNNSTNKKPDSESEKPPESTNQPPPSSL